MFWMTDQVFVANEKDIDFVPVKYLYAVFFSGRTNLGTNYKLGIDP